jgi:hypothetical protein
MRFLSTYKIYGLIDVLPSFFGSAGLFFLVLARPGKLSRLSIVQKAIVVSLLALGLEFAQLLPRPGILQRVRYIFDWLDIAGSVLGIAAAYICAKITGVKNAIE